MQETAERTWAALARVRAAVALRESEARFRALVNASSYALYRIIHPDDQPHVRHTITEAIRTKSMFELEHRVRRANGTLGWTLSRAVPVLDQNGEIVEWFGAVGDISERKRAEDEILRLNDSLEARVADRTRDLSVLYDIASLAVQSLDLDVILQ
ncbi:MAG: PAS domain-containing protein [Caldilineaceae bacterium]|nr:PAS domain-containing protein [Caldilineaceae bacterium]